jgi:hypothetical protein
VPASATARGQVWAVTVTPDDGRGSGPAGSASVTIGNAPPEITSVTLSPSSPQTNDTLSTAVVATDPDGDSVSLSYAWTVAGAAVSPTTSSLSGVSWFDRGESVVVSVTATDGTATSGAVTDSVVVANTAPGAPTVSVDPSSPTPSDDIVCAVDTASTDDDGDMVTYTIEWEVDGVAYPSGSLDTADTGFSWVGPTTTTWANDTVPADDVALGDEWTCTVTPNDGTDDGATASASAEVGGSCGAAPSSRAYSGVAELYGFCWYLGHGGETCDDICADVGGTNLANSAASAWSDSCSSPASGDVSTWFYNNGNPAGWTGGSATGYHTLGYGYVGSSYYGKCYAGTSMNHGTFPGDPNGSGTRTVVCPCFTL